MEEYKFNISILGSGETTNNRCESWEFLNFKCFPYEKTETSKQVLQEIKELKFGYFYIENEQIENNYCENEKIF